MIAAAALTEEIHAAAVEEGMLDLKMYSAWLIRQGLTTVEEVLQVVSVQE
jgi:type II secretory ATPase GspE/PulE/Tfp pilus assembly ATPase PilB-like protein